MTRKPLNQLLGEIRSCELCRRELPLGPRPIVQWKERPRLVIVGQAPGTRVHESGVPWDDDSGDHLRAWLRMDRDTFYDGARVGLMPMGFCYPGKRASGDAAPDVRCAPLWHDPLLAHAGRDALIVLVGQYAHAYYLGSERKRSLAETVRAYANYLPRYFPLPHPSWRSKIWMAKNPWFSRNVLPRLRKEIGTRLG